MNALVIGCSLNPHSHSQILADEAAAALRDRGVAPDVADLRRRDLPLCDGGHAAEADDRLRGAIEAADAVVLATPIYNYAASAAAKNLVELTGEAWRDKLVAFCCAAGGGVSYMAITGLANSLMLDFQCLIVPRFVYATGRDFADRRLESDDVRRQIGRMSGQLVHLATAMKHIDAPTNGSG